VRVLHLFATPAGFSNDVAVLVAGRDAGHACSESCEATYESGHAAGEHAREQRSNGISATPEGNQAMLRQVTRRSGKQPEATARAKLTIGPIDDPLEDEADRLARQVVRMPDTTHSAGTSVAEGSEYRHGE
jgi:hypothetical protein